MHDLITDLIQRSTVFLPRSLLHDLSLGLAGVVQPDDPPLELVGEALRALRFLMSPSRPSCPSLDCQI